jgi:hypothetical protein
MVDRVVRLRIVVRYREVMVQAIDAGVSECSKGLRGLSRGPIGEGLFDSGEARGSYNTVQARGGGD